MVESHSDFSISPLTGHNDGATIFCAAAVLCTHVINSLKLSHLYFFPKQSTVGVLGVLNSFEDCRHSEDCCRVPGLLVSLCLHLSPFVSLCLPWSPFMCRVAVLLVSLCLPSSPFVSCCLQCFFDVPVTVWGLRWYNFLTRICTARSSIAEFGGVIPADGSTEVVITFTPTRHRTASSIWGLVRRLDSHTLIGADGRTARAELQFQIAQFDFQPMMVGALLLHVDVTLWRGCRSRSLGLAHQRRQS